MFPTGFAVPPNFIITNEGVTRNLKVISRGAAAFLREKYPEVYVTEICRQKKSRRKKYFVEETDFALEVLKQYRGA